MSSRIESWNEHHPESNWTIKSWKTLSADVFKIIPPRAGSYIKTPERYANSRCGLVNIKNEDQECFKWCMKYHQTKKEKHDDRISVLSKIEDKYKYDGISYPATYDDIKKFEDMNQVCIYVYTVDDNNDIVCDSPGKAEYILNDLIYLLRVEQDGQSHYIYIKHIERLMNTHALTCHKGKKYCPICQKPVVACAENDTENGIEVDHFRKHLSECYKFAKDSTIIKLPAEGSTMEFKNYKNMLERPFIVYADTECSLCATGEEEKIARHEANSACFYLVCTFDTSRNRLWKHVGTDCIEKMVLELSRTADECVKEMQKNERMVLTDEDKKAFHKATCCHICNQPFKSDKDKVRDHDHGTGAFRGAAHNKCNINYFTNRFLPVVFHNLKGYDSHMIIRKAYEINEQLGHKKIDCIPNSYEKFMSISIEI
jgi:hypothetical protein